MNIKINIYIIIILFGITGCVQIVSSFEPITPETTIQGQKAANLVVNVKEPFVFSPRGAPITYPAGMYYPTMNTSEGILYKPQADIFVKSPFSVVYTVIQGGLIVDSSSGKILKVYFVERQGHISHEPIPLKIKYSLIKKSN